VNADSKEWEDIDIDINFDEINEILERKFTRGKKILEDKETYYSEFLKKLRNGEKEDEKSEKKNKRKIKLEKDKKYLIYGVIAFIVAFILAHILRKK